MSLVHLLFGICCLLPVTYGTPAYGHIRCDKDGRPDFDKRALDLNPEEKPGYLYPETIDELDNDYCPRVKVANNCLKGYAFNCLPPLTRQLTRHYLADNSTRFNACNVPDDVRKARILPHFRCLNRAIDKIHSCRKRSIHAMNHVNYLINGIDSERRFAYACDEYRKMRCCIETSLKESCSAIDVDIAKVYLDRNSHSTYSFVCRFYPESHPIYPLPPIPDLDHDHNESVGIRHEAQSTLLTLVDLLNKANDEYPKGKFDFESISAL